MNYFDLAILIVVALFFLLGIWKGFFKTAMSLVTWGLIFVGIYFLGEKLGTLIESTAIGTWISKGFSNMFGGMGEAAGFMVVDSNGTLMLQTSAGLISITEGLALLKIPTFLSSIIGGTLIAGQTFAAGCSSTLTGYVCIAIAAVGIAIVIGIVSAIVRHFINKFLRRTQTKGLDRFLGGVLYIAIGAIVVFGALFIIDLMSGINFMEKVIAMRDTSKIASWLTQNNPIAMLIALIGK